MWRLNILHFLVAYSWIVFANKPLYSNKRHDELIAVSNPITIDRSAFDHPSLQRRGKSRPQTAEQKERSNERRRERRKDPEYRDRENALRRKKTAWKTMEVEVSRRPYLRSDNPANTSIRSKAEREDHSLRAKTRYRDLKASNKEMTRGSNKTPKAEKDIIGLQDDAVDKIQHTPSRSPSPSIRSRQSSPGADVSSRFRSPSPLYPVPRSHRMIDSYGFLGVKPPDQGYSGSGYQDPFNP